MHAYHLSQWLIFFFIYRKYLRGEGRLGEIRL